VTYHLSGLLRNPQAVAVTRIDAQSYRADFSLPADAGLGESEILSFGFEARDGLDNISARVDAPNRFQVYQGELPPPDVPLGLSARAEPGGKVRLGWLVVDDAAAYQIYRQGPNQDSMEAHVRASGIDYIDTTPADGQYRYAVAAIRQANGQETLSGQSAAVEVTASATAPGAPQNLILQLTGQGRRSATGTMPLATSLRRLPRTATRRFMSSM
jgi:hypothetical protein